MYLAGHRSGASSNHKKAFVVSLSNNSWFDVRNLVIVHVFFFVKYMNQTNYLELHYLYNTYLYSRNKAEIIYTHALLFCYTMPIIHIFCNGFLGIFILELLIVVIPIPQSYLNQPPTLAPLLSTVRIWLHSVRGHVHMTCVIQFSLWSNEISPNKTVLGVIGTSWWYTLKKILITRYQACWRRRFDWLLKGQILIAESNGVKVGGWFKWDWSIPLITLPLFATV